jgi:predicted enzyme related to lactoylglutathione lyase
VFYRARDPEALSRWHARAIDPEGNRFELWEPKR